MLVYEGNEEDKLHDPPEKDNQEGLGISKNQHQEREDLGAVSRSASTKSLGVGEINAAQIDEEKGDKTLENLWERVDAMVDAGQVNLERLDKERVVEVGYVSCVYTAEQVGVAVDKEGMIEKGNADCVLNTN